MEPKSYKGTESITCQTAQDLRNWLSENHKTKDAVWLIIYKKESKIPSVYYSEAVDELLCFGWIDSKPNKRDDKSYYLYCSKRKPKSNWSAVNKDKIEKLEKLSKIEPAGYALIDLAKKTGTWDALEKVDNLVLPEEMAVLLDPNIVAKNYWEAFPKSTKMGILQWIYSAKTLETKLKRINETILLATKNKRANQYEPR